MQAQQQRDKLPGEVPLDDIERLLEAADGAGSSVVSPAPRVAYQPGSPAAIAGSRKSPFGLAEASWTSRDAEARRTEQQHDPYELFGPGRASARFSLRTSIIGPSNSRCATGTQVLSVADGRRRSGDAQPA